MRANACVRKKRNSTPELWRPCHLRSGYGDEPITRVKTLRQVRDTENMRNHILWSGYLGVSEPRMEDLKSLQSGEHSQYLQAHTLVSLEQDWRFCSGTWNHLKLYFVCSQPVPLAVVAGQSKIFRTCPNVRC